LAALERDRRALHRALLILRADIHRLVISAGGQAETHGDGAGRRHVDAAAAGLAGECAGGIACRFTPGATDVAAGIIDTGAQVEIVALAGAPDVELQVGALAQHVVARPAAQLLAAAVVQLDRAGTGPLSGERYEGTAVLRLRGESSGHAKANEYQKQGCAKHGEGLILGCCPMMRAPRPATL